MSIQWQLDRPVIRTHSLGKWYGRKVALRFLSTEVKDGEMVGLLGVNGAGKSTLMNLLTGLAPPSEGFAEVFGFPPGSRASKRELGWLPEFFFAPENMPVVRLLRFYAEVYAMPYPRYLQRLEELVEAFRMGDSLHAPIGTLSKGLLRRVGIIRCLLNEPRLILMDEPGWSLDPLGRQALQKVLMNERKRGATILVSSHVLDIVEDFCDRFLILQNGKCVADVHRSELRDPTAYEVEFSGDSAGAAAFFQANGISVERNDGRHAATLPSALKDEAVRHLVSCGCALERLAPKKRDLLSILSTLKDEGVLS